MVDPGCTKRLPESASTSPAAIFSSVDLPEALRPIRQTRSEGDTDNSTPASNGVPPKVSAISFSWIRGGAISSDSILVLGGRDRLLALDAADSLIECGQERRPSARGIGFRPAVLFARRAKIGHQITNRQGHPDRLFGERLAVRRDHFGAGLDAAAGQRNVRSDDDVALRRTLRDPVAGRIHAGARRDAFDQRVLRHANEWAGDHRDGQAMPNRDAVDLV